MTQSKTPFIVVLSLAMTMMLGPFSMDTYLPAFPVIGESLGISQQAVSLSVSVYVLALALGQLIGGALSDRFGRQRVLMSGLAIFALSSIVIGMADSLNTLLGGPFRPLAPVLLWYLCQRWCATEWRAATPRNCSR